MQERSLKSDIGIQEPSLKSHEKDVTESRSNVPNLRATALNYESNLQATRLSTCLSHNRIRVVYFGFIGSKGVSLLVYWVKKDPCCTSFLLGQKGSVLHFFFIGSKRIRVALLIYWVIIVSVLF